MLFGMTEAQFSEFAVRWGTIGLMVFMGFIVWELAKRSDAGKTGTKVLFLVLGLGCASFIAKTIIEAVLGI